MSEFDACGLKFYGLNIGLIGKFKSYIRLIDCSFTLVLVGCDCERTSCFFENLSVLVRSLFIFFI